MWKHIYCTSNSVIKVSEKKTIIIKDQNISWEPTIWTPSILIVWTKIYPKNLLKYIQWEPNKIPLS